MDTVPVGYHHFFTLGLEPEASMDEIKAAYRQSVKKFHPDRPGGNALIFHRVQAAYDALCKTPEREKFLSMHYCRPGIRAPSGRTRRFSFTAILKVFAPAGRKTHRSTPDGSVAPLVRREAAEPSPAVWSAPA